MKKRIVIACVLFAVAAIAEWTAGKVMPFEEIFKKALPKA